MGYVFVFMVYYWFEIAYQCLGLVSNIMFDRFGWKFPNVDQVYDLGSLYVLQMYFKTKKQTDGKPENMKS